MKLKNVATCELVEELQKRDGVEYFDVYNEFHYEINIHNTLFLENGNVLPGEIGSMIKDTGPATIFVVID